MKHNNLSANNRWRSSHPSTGVSRKLPSKSNSNINAGNISKIISNYPEVKSNHAAIASVKNIARGNPGKESINSDTIYSKKSAELINIQVIESNRKEKCIWRCPEGEYYNNNIVDLQLLRKFATDDESIYDKYYSNDSLRQQLTTVTDKNIDVSELKNTGITQNAIKCHEDIMKPTPSITVSTVEQYFHHNVPPTTFGINSTLTGSDSHGHPTRYITSLEAPPLNPWYLSSGNKFIIFLTLFDSILNRHSKLH